MDVADGVEKDARLLECPVNGEVDILLIVQWLVPCFVCMRASPPGPIGDGFDRLHGDITLLAGGEQGIEVFRVVGTLHGQEVVGQQHRIEVVAFQAAPMGGGNLQPVSGNADSAYQALMLRLDSCFNRAAGTESNVPLDGVDEVVQLPQVYRVNAHAFEGAMQILLRGLSRARRFSWQQKIASDTA